MTGRHEARAPGGRFSASDPGCHRRSHPAVVVATGCRACRRSSSVIVGRRRTRGAAFSCATRRVARTAAHGVRLPVRARPHARCRRPPSVACSSAAYAWRDVAGLPSLRGSRWSRARRGVARNRGWRAPGSVPIGLRSRAWWTTRAALPSRRPAVRHRDQSWLVLIAAECVSGEGIGFRAQRVGDRPGRARALVISRRSIIPHQAGAPAGGWRRRSRIGCVTLLLWSRTPTTFKSVPRGGEGGQMLTRTVLQQADVTPGSDPHLARDPRVQSRRLRSRPPRHPHSRRPARRAHRRDPRGSRARLRAPSARST